MEASPLFNRPPRCGEARQPLLARDELAPSAPDAPGRRALTPPLALSPASTSPALPSRLPASQPRSPSAGGRASEEEERTGPSAGPPAPVSFLSFIGHQLLVGVDETVTAEMEDESARRRRKGVYHFLRAPWELEKLLVLGYLVCLDSFLFMLTMLPLRVAASLCMLAARRRLSWLQVCDAMCVGAIAIAVLALEQIDTSQAYHSVKGQAVIKLYVVFNVLEVFDKLCASFGQDILHTLFWSSMARRTWQGHLLLDFAIVAVYLVVHSCVLFYQVVSLNVAVNSHNNVMLTLLVSNNFVELKSNVFKRFEPDNLFVLSCSDMIERFQLTCYLLIVALHVLTVHADSVVLANVLGAIGMVSAAELLVDWIKHAFVIKFNGIQPTIYRRFHAVVCRDLANSVAGGHDDRQAGPHMLQSSAAASTRIGFSCIPLICLVVRSVGQFVRWLQLTRSPTGWAIIALVWLLLFLLKALLSVALAGYACEQTLGAAPAARASMPGLRDERSQSFTAEWLGADAVGASATAPALASRGGLEVPSAHSERSDASTSPAMRERHLPAERAGAGAAGGADERDGPHALCADWSVSMRPSRARAAPFAELADQRAGGLDARPRASAGSLKLRRNGVGSGGGSGRAYGADNAMLELAGRPARGIPSIESSAEL